MRSAYWKDIFQTIKKSRKRFIAIMIITVLGVTMFSGLQAACADLRTSADRFFDQQDLHDFEIQSTLGLTQEDVDVLQSLDLVDTAEGIYSETVLSHIGDQDFSLSMRTLPESGIDTPYVTEGRLPESADECVVTEKFLADSGLSVGDSLTIKETLDPGDEDTDPEEPSFLVTDFTITGSVVDVTDVDNPSGATSYRSSTLKDPVVLILPSAVQTDVYTSVLVTLTGARGLFCYGSKYETLVEQVTDMMESEIKLQREQARYNQIISDAEQEIADAEAEVNEELADAYQQLIDGESELKSQLADAYQQLMDGESELKSQLADAYQQLIDSQQQIKDGKLQIKDGLAQLEANEKQLDDAEKQIEANEKQLNDAEKQIEDGEKQLAEGEKQLADGRAQLEAGKKELEEQETAALAQLAEAKDLLDTLSSASGALSARAASDKSDAESTLGDSFPAEDWDSAVSVIDSKLEPALENAMSDIDMTSLDTDQLKKASELISQENPDAREVISFIQEVLGGSASSSSSQDAAAQTLSDLYASMQAMSADDWQKVGEEVFETASSLNDLSTSYTAAVAEQEAALQAQINAIQSADPQPEDAQAQIDALRQQQTALISSDINIIGYAVENAAAQAFSAIIGKSLNEYSAQEKAAKDQLADAHKQLEESEKELEDGEAEIAANRQKLEDSKVAIADGRKSIADARNTIADARKSIADARNTITEKQKELEKGEKQLADGWKEYYEGKAEGEQKLADGWEEYYEGKAEGEQELADGWAEYYDGLAEAQDSFAEAREKLKDIDTATWYIQDRTSLSGYTNIGSDADSIDALATVFPILFFVVAVLISLTTITRMVEEDRGLIGTYKALGFTNAEIRRKYVIYAGAAGAAGSLVGTFFAFIVLPFIVCIIFRTMYLLPEYGFTFLPAYGLTGPVLFILGVMAATLITCRKELQITPAALMRPKAPKGGNRVFLEYIKPVWNRMSFLNKVTARNLFRYKKRLFMTIAGIAGCMALLLFGYAVKDSVHDLMPNQYEKTFHYDLLAVVQPDDNDKLLSYVGATDAGETGDTGDSAEAAGNSTEAAGNSTAGDISQLVNLEITSVTVKYNDDSLDIQLMVFPDADSLKEFISLRDPSGESLDFADGDIYVTENAGNVLGFSAGDTISMQLTDLQLAEFTVDSLCQNYLSNYVFLTAKTFEQYYDAYEPNGVLLSFNESCDREAFAANLKKQDGIISCLLTDEIREGFSTAFMLINMVVYVIIIMSAALAFVVLFTLSTTNISERERELATIKVLGFYDNEVHLYVDKETILLTLIGILLGIPLGRALASTLTVVLNLPSIYLAVSLHPISYVISAALSLFFALVVGFIMDRTLDRINPVEALKSVE